MSEDLQCKENDRKSKIEGNWRVSDRYTHHRGQVQQSRGGESRLYCHQHQCPCSLCFLSIHLRLNLSFPSVEQSRLRCPCRWNQKHIGNVSGVLRGRMPKLPGAEDKAKAKLAWELIYKRRATLKGKQSPKTLPRTPGTPLPPNSLTHFSLLQCIKAPHPCQQLQCNVGSTLWWHSGREGMG